MTATQSEPVNDSTVAAARLKSSPRRCFICLTDEDPTDSPGTWVDPCPCTLEAHQDCMLSWVTDCERSNRPLKCPVCKSLIELEGRWNPIVATFDTVKRRFTRLSPYILFTGITTGIQFSFQMYGALAMWVFSGKDALLHYVITTPAVANAANGTLSFAKDRVMPSIVMFSVGPALLLANIFPGFSNRIFVPTASIYGVLNMMHDETFLSWPPSPQLTIAVYPYIRSIYYNLWRELVLPYELKLNKQLMGQPTQTTAPLENEEAGIGAAPERGADAAAARRREMDRNEPGVIEMLQTLVEALGGDDENGAVPGGDANENAEGHQRMVFELGFDDDGGNQDAQLALAIEVEEIIEGDDAPPPHANDRPVAEGQAPDAGAIPAVGADGIGLGVPGEHPGANAIPNHEAPAPPVQRLGLGGVLSYLSDAVVGALILPGISFVAGECLRVLLPRKWTIPATRDPSTYRYIGGRPGLLQLQWGRSLVGGSLYIVLRDILRIYTKTRKVAALSTRRVKNVDRPRRTRK